jgi:hypothetical protein
MTQQIIDNVPKEINEPDVMPDWNILGTRWAGNEQCFCCTRRYSGKQRISCSERRPQGWHSDW